MKDKYGIPVLRFHWKWTDHEINQVKHMQETFRALVAEMGGEVFSAMPTKERGYGIATGGSIIHELGTVRMGSDPKTSVLNAIVPGVGLQEPVRRRRRLVRVAGGQEPDVDDHGAGDADGGQDPGVEEGGDDLRVQRVRRVQRVHG